MSIGTRDKILDTAQRLTQTRSFQGFSFQDIADDIGIRKPSLYHHFASKDDVAIAMLDRAADWVRAHLAASDGLSPTKRLEAYLAMFSAIHGKAERMCPGGSFAAIFGAVSSSVQSALHRFTLMHLDWLDNLVRDGVAAGEFEIGDQKTRDVAMQLLSNVQGALLVGRMAADPHALETVATEIRRYLGIEPAKR